MKTSSSSSSVKSQAEKNDPPHKPRVSKIFVESSSSLPQRVHQPKRFRKVNLESNPYRKPSRAKSTRKAAVEAKKALVNTKAGTRAQKNLESKSLSLIKQTK